MIKHYHTNAQTSGQLTKLAYNRIEAAHMLGISPASLDRLTNRGLLNPSRALRRPIYAATELQRFLDETRCQLEVA